MQPLLNFGQALESLKLGKKVARLGWNGKKMFIYLVKGQIVTREQLRNEADQHYPNMGNIEHIRIGDHIDMKAADGSIVVGWLASQTDMLAEDWLIIE